MVTANRQRSVNVAPVPHSWDLEGWPAHVYPHNTSRAKYLIRVHRNELFLAGALSRVGREFVVLGARYARWLESKTADAPHFDNGAARTASARSAAR
jgi:hypothetical protein